MRLNESTLAKFKHECHLGLVNDHGDHLVNEPHLSLFAKC